MVERGGSFGTNVRDLYTQLQCLPEACKAANRASKPLVKHSNSSPEPSNKGCSTDEKIWLSVS